MARTLTMGQSMTSHTKYISVTDMKLMGVPYLLSYLRRTYKSVFSHGDTPRLDHVYLDANAMLYQIAEVTKDPAEIAAQLVLVAQAYATVYGGQAHIYIDGAAHMAKLREQRIRRFRYDPVSVTTESNVEPGSRMGSYDASVSVPWTSAMFSPGTKVMNDIHLTLETMTKNDPLIGTYSSYLEPAEGEHKIVDDIKLLPSGTSIGIVGKDADLLLIGMVLVEKGYNAYVLRHNDTPDGNRDGYRPEDPIWNISCSMLRNEIITSIAKDSIWDFIIGTFVVGNDFLPPIPEMSNLREVMPLITSALAKLPSSLHDGDGINWPMMHEYIRYLYGHAQPDTRWIGIEGDIGKESFSVAYYTVMSPFTVDVKGLTYAWMKTVDWVYQYYQNGPTAASVSWQFPANFSPTLHTLAKEMDPSMEVEPDEIVPALEPHQALACILPPWLWNLLPQDVQDKMPNYGLYYPYAYSVNPVTDAAIVPIIPYRVASSI